MYSTFHIPSPTSPKPHFGNGSELWTLRASGGVPLTFSCHAVCMRTLGMRAGGRSRTSHVPPADPPPPTVSSFRPPLLLLLLLLAVSPLYVNADSGCSTGAAGEKPTGAAATSALVHTSVGRSPYATDRLETVLVSPSGNTLYATSSVNNQILVLSRNVNANLAPAPVEAITDVDYPWLISPSAMAMPKDGNNLYVVAVDKAKQSNCICWFSVSVVDGSLTNGDVICTTVSYSAGVAGAAGVRVSADGNHVYVTWAQKDFDEDMVSTYARDRASGGTLVKVVGGGSADSLSQVMTPLGIAMDPASNYVYVLGTGYDNLLWFSRSATGGEIAYKDYIGKADVGHSDMNEISAIVIHPNGKFVYTLSKGNKYGIVILYTRDDTSGVLLFKGVQSSMNSGDAAENPDGLHQSPLIDDKSADAMVISSDGVHLYCSGYVWEGTGGGEL